MNLDDTIVAVATAPGRGGIGVVRIAGARAIEIAAPMLRLKHALEPGRAVFGEFVELELVTDVKASQNLHPSRRKARLG